MAGPGCQPHPEGEVEQIADALEFNGPAVWFHHLRMHLFQLGKRFADQPLWTPPSGVRPNMLGEEGPNVFAAFGSQFGEEPFPERGVTRGQEQPLAESAQNPIRDFEGLAPLGQLPASSTIVFLSSGVRG